MVNNNVELLEKDLENNNSKDEEVQINVSHKKKKFDTFRMKYKKDKKKYIVIMVAMLIMLSTVVGTSYAYLRGISKTNNSVVISAGTIALTFQNDENVLDIYGAVPMSDEDGLAQSTEYSFDVKNNGTIPAVYTITLDNTCEAGNGIDLCIPDQYIKVGIKTGSEEYKVLEKKDQEKYIIETGELQKGQSQRYKMKIWLDYNTPNTYNAVNDQVIAYKGKLGLTYKQGKLKEGYLKVLKTLVNTNQIIDFSQAPSDTNGNGVNILEGTENDPYPIYFFRGFDTEGKNVVSRNNVLFGGFCWKIVRTTDTGGIKIVYNGTPTNDNKCNKPLFVSDGGRSDSTSELYMSSSDSYYYGTEYIFDENLGYSLSGTKTNGVWSSDFVGKYTCKSTSSTGTCTTLYYLDAYNSTIQARAYSYNAVSNSQLSVSSAFNSSYNSPAYVGYMYGTVYPYKSGAPTEGSLFGSSFTFSNGTYTLTNTTSAADNTHHYTCNNTTGTCATIRYYYYISGSNNYYIELTNGKSVSDALEEMQTNTTDSTIKTVIDDWYEENLENYESYLEDTVWCNDRSMQTTTNGWKENGSLTEFLYYGANGRVGITHNSITPAYIPDVTCPNKNDAFTANDTTKGNGNLDYPIALLTADELTMAGSGRNGYSTSSFLYNGKDWWTLSPCYDSSNATAVVFRSAFSGVLGNNGVKVFHGVRPAVSLAPGTDFASGDGSADNPYKVE